MKSKYNFVRQFFKNKKMVGAITPSTKFLGKKMLKNIDFNSSKLLIELGPGTGVFTDLIIEQMAKDAQLYVFEVNKNFYANLVDKINDPRVKILNDSAENIEKYINKEVDVIISSLPLMVFSNELRENVITTSYKSLKKDGIYLQFQYTLQSKKILQKTYDKVDVSFTIKNIPPAFIYSCTKE